MCSAFAVKSRTCRASSAPGIPAHVWITRSADRISSACLRASRMSACPSSAVNRVALTMRLKDIAFVAIFTPCALTRRSPLPLVLIFRTMSFQSRIASLCVCAYGPDRPHSQSHQIMLSSSFQLGPVWKSFPHFGHGRSFSMSSNPAFQRRLRHEAAHPR